MSEPKTIEVPEELVQDAAATIDILTDETSDKDFRREAIRVRKRLEAVLNKSTTCEG